MRFAGIDVGSRAHVIAIVPANPLGERNLIRKKVVWFVARGATHRVIGGEARLKKQLLAQRHFGRPDMPKTGVVEPNATRMARFRVGSVSGIGGRR